MRIGVHYLVWGSTRQYERMMFRFGAGDVFLGMGVKLVWPATHSVLMRSWDMEQCAGREQQVVAGMTEELPETQPQVPDDICGV